MNTDELLKGEFAYRHAIERLTLDKISELDVEELATDIANAIVNSESDKLTLKIRKILAYIKNNSAELALLCHNNENADGDIYTFVYILLSVSEVESGLIKFNDVMWVTLEEKLITPLFIKAWQRIKSYLFFIHAT